MARPSLLGFATGVTACAVGEAGWRDGRSAFSLRPECHPALSGILDALRVIYHFPCASVPRW